MLFRSGRWFHPVCHMSNDEFIEYQCSQIAALTARAEQAEEQLKLLADGKPCVVTRFDDYVKHKEELAAEKAARERAEQEAVRLREVLMAVDEWDLNWADGLDANVERIKAMVRAALEGDDI